MATASNVQRAAGAQPAPAAPPVPASAFAPAAVTGTDPTITPMGALGVPILGAFLTWFVCTFVKAWFEQYRA